MTNPTHPEKRIHTRSFPHVETERLHARLEHVRVNLPALARACEQKGDFRAHAREIVNLERELTYRGEAFDTLTDGRHLQAVPVSTDMRTFRPR